MRTSNDETLVHERQVELYRAFDKEKQLLYVGISLNVFNRLMQHRRSSRWYKHADSITICRYPTIEYALAAEKIAIQSEKPLYNIRNALPRENDDIVDVLAFDPFIEAVRQGVAQPDFIPAFILEAPGMLGRIAGWMAETAPKYQPGLFLAAALALGATVMGRLYRTDTATWPSLYIVMVAKSGEGKEHPQSCVAKILAAASLENLLAGSGYTSPGAVHSALLHSPSHIAIIDEIGKMLKMSRAVGSAQSEAAIDKLIEAFGKCDSFMKPANYSLMMRNNNEIEKRADRIVFNPAITLLGATTPDTFYQSLNADLIKEGFLGRLIVVHSKRSLQKTHLVDQTPPPGDIVDWVRAVVEEGAADPLAFQNPKLPAKPVIMQLSNEARRLFDQFDDELIRLKDANPAEEASALLARTQEKAVRVAMIVAKATNPPRDNTIRSEAAAWAIKYVRYYDLNTVLAVQFEGPENRIDTQISRALRIIGAAKSYKHKQFQHVLKFGGMPHSKLSKDMGLSLREFKAMIDTAIDQGYITKTDGCPEAGFAGVVYWLR